VSFVANCFLRMEEKCVKKLALLHEFDDNVAVVATTVASITTGIVQFQGKLRLLQIIIIIIITTIFIVLSS